MHISSPMIRLMLMLTFVLVQGLRVAFLVRVVFGDCSLRPGVGFGQLFLQVHLIFILKKGTGVEPPKQMQ